MHLWEGDVKEESFHTLGRPFAGRDCGWQKGELRSHGGERSNRGAEGKAERFPHKGCLPTSIHQPEMLAHPLGRVGAGR